MYVWSPHPEQLFEQGVGVGFGSLTHDFRYAPGYSSVQQRPWVERFCARGAHGLACRRSAEALFSIEPETEKPWIELLGYRTVVVHDRRGLLESWRRAAGSEWREVRRTRDFAAFPARPG